MLRLRCGSPGSCPPARLLLGGAILAILVGIFSGDLEAASRQQAPVAAAFPLRASDNDRYLVDQENRPFLIVGDAPQTMVANLSREEAIVYLDNRRRYGVNTLWINLLCNFSDGCNRTASTFDNINPFVQPGDLAQPNPAYFDRADELIRLAGDRGMIVLLDPIETSSWLPILRAGGRDKAFEYGQYLGRRYKAFPNIVWLHGNDFQTWRRSSDNILVQAVANGIRSEDSEHLHTVELNFFTSGSLDDPTWAPLVELDAAYSYFPTFAQVLTEYNHANHKPVFLIEGNYEFEHNANTDGGALPILRRQQYWAMLSGAAGYVYGSSYTWRLQGAWRQNLDTPGAEQLQFMQELFTARKWQNLIPDQAHEVVVAGYDAWSERMGKWAAYFSGNRVFPLAAAKFARLAPLTTMATNGYVATARSADGTLAISYLPTSRTITVDMSRLAGAVNARWFDPTDAHYVAAAGSPLPKTGRMQFTPPPKNAAGDSDWLLILETVGAGE